MNWGRPAALAILAAAVFGLGWVLVKDRGLGRVEEHPLSVSDAQIARIRMTFGDSEIVLDSPKPGEWTLPGNWPVRQTEARELARTLSLGDSRFEPQPITSEKGWKDLGLDKPAVIAELTRREGGRLLKIALGQPSPTEGSNRFSLATYARINDGEMAWRLAPGLIDQLSRPLDYYRQRRLFAGTRPPRDPDAGVPRPGDPIRKEQLAGKEVILEQQPGAKIRLVRSGEGAFTQWSLAEPAGPDNLNPVAGDALLAAVPDLWAERFYTGKEASPEKTGLEAPEKVIRVISDNGRPIVLRIGKVSRSRTYKKMRQPPPGAPPGFPAGEETMSEDFRYARLEDNPQVFEVKAAGLAEIFAGPDALRDPLAARFVTSDATRVAVDLPGKSPFTLVKADNSWKIERAGQLPLVDADPAKVNDLLTRLSGMDTKDKEKDLIAPATPDKRKELGLVKPSATLKVTVKETASLWPKDASGNRPSRERSMEIQLGRRDEKNKKIAVAVAGINRLNEVDDAVVATATRESLAYRDRKIPMPSLASIQTVRLFAPGSREPVTIQKDKESWKLTTPAATAVDEGLVSQLTSALSSLEAGDWIRETADKSTLEKEYGLGDSASRVEIVTAPEAGKPGVTTIVFVGRARPSTKKETPPPGPGQPPEPAEKPTFYAQISDRPEVFTLGADLQSQIVRPVLAWLPRSPLNLNADDLTSLKILKPGQPPVLLVKKGPGPVAPDQPMKTIWKLKEPFDTDLVSAKSDPLLGGLVGLKVESYEALKTEQGKDLGLGDKATKVVLAIKDKPDLTLEIGDAKGGSRVARVAGQAPVFLLPAELAKNIDGAPLGLLENVALAIDTTRVESVRFYLAGGNHQLARLTGGEQTGAGSGWVVRAKEGEMPADTEAISTLLGTLFNLRGGRFIAYGSKVDLKAYGLDVPRIKVVVRLQSADQPLGAPKPGNVSGTEEHTIEIGSPIADEPGSFHARIDAGQGVMAIGPDIVRALERKPLDLVDRILVRLDPNPIRKFRLIRGAETVEVVREGDAWKQTKPIVFGADNLVVQDWLADIARLRSEQVVAFKPADSKALGLEPAQGIVEWEIVGPDGKPQIQRLQLGKEEQKGRLARLEGTGTVGRLSERLNLAFSPRSIWFKDRSIGVLGVSVGAFDGAKWERGPRKITLARQGPFWKMTEPVQAEVDADALARIASNLAKLSVSEWISDKATPEKLKEYGLDKPFGSWTLTLAGKPVLELQLGSRLADGRIHGKLAGKDPVFLLDLPVAERLMGEVRSQRNVFEPPIDALSIESVRWISRTAGTTQLVRKGEGWEIAGKPEVKLLTETVNDTLGAFASLRLERYATDKGGDAKLFGLDPAETVIEITSRSGTRILKIGTAEEGSPRRFAVADKTAPGEILVLGQADLERLLRSPAQLAKPLPPSVGGNLKLAPLDPVGGN